MVGPRRYAVQTSPRAGRKLPSQHNGERTREKAARQKRSRLGRGANFAPLGQPAWFSAFPTLKPNYQARCLQQSRPGSRAERRVGSQRSSRSRLKLWLRLCCNAR